MFLKETESDRKVLLRPASSGCLFGYMEEDRGTRISQPHVEWKEFNANYSGHEKKIPGAAVSMGQQKNASASIDHGIDMVVRNQKIPVFASTEWAHLQLGQTYESRHWCYCFPFAQSFMPGSNFAIEAKLSAGPQGNLTEETKPKSDLGFPQKKFLVIDRSGDQTTLIYSSGFGSPIQLHASQSPRLQADYNLKEDEAFIKGGSSYLKLPVLTDENKKTDVPSEMHENTEEIDALLDTDDDGYSTEEDEVTSTGHSPSTMTAHNNVELFLGSTKEVADSATKTRKRKRCSEPCDDIELLDTANSVNPDRSFEFEDDAESRCASGDNQGSGEMHPSSGYKRMRKERIRDILSVLQSIIPGGKDKGPAELLDKAIHICKSLKLKVETLGLDVF